jgi:hypothetical protein
VADDVSGQRSRLGSRRRQLRPGLGSGCRGLGRRICHVGGWSAAY